MILSLGICCIVAIMLLILAKTMGRKECKADTFDGVSASEVEMLCRPMGAVTLASCWKRIFSHNRHAK